MKSYSDDDIAALEPEEVERLALEYEIEWRREHGDDDRADRLEAQLEASYYDFDDTTAGAAWDGFIDSGWHPDEWATDFWLEWGEAYDFDLHDVYEMAFGYEDTPF